MATSKKITDISDPVKLTSAVGKPTSVFAKFEAQAWPYVYRVTLDIGVIAGGVPTDPKIAEGWIKSKTDVPDNLLRKAVAETMAQMAVSVDDAVEAVAKQKTLNGFKRERCDQCPPEGLCAEGKHLLFVEGRQVKAMIKEGCSVAYAGDKLLNNGKNAW